MKTLQFCFFFMVLLVSQSRSSEAKLWRWFALEPAAAKPESHFRHTHCSNSRPTDLARFDVESANFLSNSRGKDLVEKAQLLTTKHSCWHEAYTGLVSSCREILKEEETKARLAMRLTNCFLQVSGRAPQHCSDSMPISKCTSGLSDHENTIFLAFFIDAASMCHHLQSEAFKQETEHVVNELKGSAHWVEGKLKSMESQTQVIESQTNVILQQTNDMISEQKLLQVKLQERSDELMEEYQRLHVEMRERIRDGLSGLNSATEEVHKQLQVVASVQKDMSAHQQTLADSLTMEFETLHKQTYEISSSLTKEFSSLHKKSHEIAASLTDEFSSLNKISHEITDSLTTQFSSLHEQTHSIGKGVQRSLTGQEALLAGQGQAMEDLHSLKKLQEVAMEESRASVLELTREAKMHQQDFLAWQRELHIMHQKLAIGSNAMLEAQEAFVSKQAAVFTSLEQLFSLHNAILLESRALKTFLFYVASSIFVYMSTSSKQTNNARALLICGLLFTFAVELWLLRYQMTSTSRGVHQILLSSISPRIMFGISSVILLLYNILNYRDYTTLSYEILVDLQKHIKAPPSSSPFRNEEVCQQSSTPQTKSTRITTPYEKSLTKKILRRARACRSHPFTWSVPMSSLIDKYKEKQPLHPLIASISDSPAHLNDEVIDPDYSPAPDAINSLTTSPHNYNLRPCRRSRSSSINISSLSRE